MSDQREVKRWNCYEVEINGDYVLASDYDAALAEIERLNGEFDKQAVFIRCRIEEIEKLDETVYQQGKEIERLTTLLGMCKGELREHRWCGDAYPPNGWPGVNSALAAIALYERGEEAKP